MLARLNAQRQCLFFAGRSRFQLQDFAAVAMTPGGDFVSDVMHFQQRGVRFSFGDEGADTLHAD
ncbi:hypothetical protein D3C71_1679940 [compost metagenome]